MSKQQPLRVGDQVEVRGLPIIRGLRGRVEEIKGGRFRRRYKIRYNEGTVLFGRTYTNDTLKRKRLKKVP